MIKIFTDGGARGNPGPAAGAFVVYEDSSEIFKSSKYLGEATNNMSEYSALLLAFEWLWENKNKLEVGEINFYLDSELVVRQMTGIYKIKDKNLLVIARRIQSIKSKFTGKISFTAIPRIENKEADLLVNKALDENIL